MPNFVVFNRSSKSEERFYGIAYSLLKLYFLQVYVAPLYSRTPQRYRNWFYYYYYYKVFSSNFQFQLLYDDIANIVGHSKRSYISDYSCG